MMKLKVIFLITLLGFSVGCCNESGNAVPPTYSLDSILVEIENAKVIPSELLFSSRKEDDNYSDFVKLSIRSKHDTLSGYLLGAMYDGEHGIYYYATELKNILQADNGYSFSMVPGSLYTEPIKLQQYLEGENFTQAVGKDHSEYRLKLDLQSSKAILSCALDEDALCPVDSIQLFKIVSSSNKGNGN